MAKQEEKIQVSFCQYLRAKHPKIIFRSDGAGLKLPMGLAVKFKKIQKDRAYPDMFIAEPVGKYHGLYIEIKKDFDTLYKKDGTIRQDVHTLEQLKSIQDLQAKGYYACFACGIDDCIKILEDYLIHEKLESFEVCQEGLM